MKRVDGWQLNLKEYLQGRLNTPLIWGQSDCCLFVADAVQVITGGDIAHWFRGQYDTRRGAFNKMKEYCQGSVQETFQMFAELNGFNEVQAIETGDIVLLKADACDPVAGRLSNGMTVGLGLNFGTISQGKDGLVLTEEPEVVKVWRL